MSTTQQPPKSSRWGSFLQQAVAGVESRLDTILTDVEDNSSKILKQPETNAQQPTRWDHLSGSPSAFKVDDGSPRTRSNSRNNDRLQERLARAMVGKDNARTGGSPTPSSHTASRTASPAPGVDGVQQGPVSQSVDSDPVRYDSGLLREVLNAATDNNQISNKKSADTTNGTESRFEPQDENLQLPAQNSGITSHTSLDLRTSPSTRHSDEVDWNSVTISTDEANGQGDVSKPPATVKTAAEYEATLSQLRSDYEVSEMRRQEEVHTYTERIDALQAKLQYLSRESAELARASAASAPKGSLERKVAEQEEQIGLLMEEGQKLSKTELKNMTVIKKLRAKLNEDEKTSLEALQKVERAEKQAAEAKEKLKRAEAAEKRASDKLRSYSKLEKDVEALKTERESNNVLIASLRMQAAQSNAKTIETDKAAQTATLEAERKVVFELRNDLSSAKIEQQLAQEKARAEVQELREKADRERERARLAEAESRREQSSLESKMEAWRARAEEITMGATGDAQAKLFRQIETLQTQYAVSSDNWQRIEESLMARVTGLEQEREVLSRREHELRQKARDFNMRAKHTEEELDQSSSRLRSVEQDLTERDTQLQKLHGKAKQLEEALKNARAEFDRERQTWELEYVQRVEQEKVRWREEASQFPASIPRSRTQSPVTYNRKGSSSDFYNLQHRRTRGHPPSIEVPSGFPDSASDRRLSAHPSSVTETGALFRQDSVGQIPHVPVNGSMPRTPSIHTPDQDDPFDSHLSPQPTVNDMISISTVGAGPSVQLVERMSAAVRRLESEKAALKDELTRLSAQRDEARDEVLLLMREVEQKRAVDERVKGLEAEVMEINERYQTTLEMLGEKSELVEELRADVADMKNIYRDLLDRTIK